MPKTNKTEFEGIFRQFVGSFGGEIFPEQAEDSQRSADYFFRQHNVVAELKCLVVDQTADTSNKLREIIDQRRASAGPQAGQQGVAQIPKQLIELLIGE
jgi:hypothetical protein